MLRSAASLSSPYRTLETVNQLISFLLLASLSVKSFISRWQVLRAKLSDLRSSIEEIITSSHWTENSLLQSLLPCILSNLQQLKSLSDRCSISEYRGGKLRMQSDLDMASAAISKQSHGIHILLRSGVLRHSNAIVLSQPPLGAETKDLGFFVRDLFTRLQIGGTEFKKKALESLLHLLNSDEKSASVLSKEGNISYLINLLDAHSHHSIREQAIAAIAIIAKECKSSRKILFEEGGLGPLLKILDNGTLITKEKAAVAIEAITSDPDRAWAISAYDGASILVESCRSGSSAIQAHAAGIIKNVSVVEDVRIVLAEKGVISVLLQLLMSGSNSTQEISANCIALFASSGELFQTMILREIGVHNLLHLLHGLPDSETLEHILRAITSLSLSDSVNPTLSSSTVLIIQLAEMIKNGRIAVQYLAVSLLAQLSISNESKRAIRSCIRSLVRLMEIPKPPGLQEAASEVLVSLLSVVCNCYEFVRDEKSLVRLLQMLDTESEAACKKFPIAVLSAILAGGSSGCRRKLVAAGAIPHVQKLADMDVAGARKALQRLSGGRFRNFLHGIWM